MGDIDVAFSDFQVYTRKEKMRYFGLEISVRSASKMDKLFDQSVLVAQKRNGLKYFRPTKEPKSLTQYSTMLIYAIYAKLSSQRNQTTCNNTPQSQPFMWTIRKVMRLPHVIAMAFQIGLYMM